MTILQHAIAKALGSTSYQIARSLRFNSADQANLTRTPVVNGNRKTWTLAFWYKRSKLGALQSIYGTPYNINSDGIRFEANDTFTLYSNDANNASIVTSQAFRDVAAPAFYMVSVDTTQATPANRVKLYCNGSQITALATASYPAQNYDFNINSTAAQAIGRNPITTNQFLDGLLADIYFIDGQQLDPTSFGQIDSATGVWVPKAYTGTYGANGWHLDFSDNSNNTATTLGKDTSGNGNNWTPNNFSVTAGVGNDSLVDSPTWYGTDMGAGGEVRGNYATLNPITASFNTNITFTEGNLRVTKANSTHDWRCFATMALPSSGKWFWEWTIFSFGPGDGTLAFGLADQQYVSGTYGQYASNPRQYQHNGNKYSPAGGSVAYGASFTTNDVIGVAYDADNGTLTFYKNGTSQGTAFTGLNSGIEWYPWMTQTGNPSNGSYYANFGQRPFAYTAPSGFKALCTTNLPTPAIALPGQNMNVVTYTGNGVNGRSITGVGFQPDFVWIKRRDASAFDHVLKAVGQTKFLSSSTTDADRGNAGDLVTSLDTDGFTVNTTFSGGTTNATTNGNAATYVAWNWKANGAAVSNTAGSITSQVSANAAAGISVVSYTGNGATGATVGHGLGVAPELVIVKNRTDAATYWNSYHASLGAGSAVDLNTTAAATASAFYWNNTASSSSVFTVNTNGSGYTNVNTKNYIAYCFAEVPGFSKFGSYTGNGSADGPFVYCGFRPRWIMIKNTTTAATNWQIIDTARDSYNDGNGLALWANLATAETTYAASRDADVLSNGFKLRSTDGDTNASGATYIFAAFAESPFNYSRAR